MAPGLWPQGLITAQVAPADAEALVAAVSRLRGAGTTVDTYRDGDLSPPETAAFRALGRAIRDGVDALGVAYVDAFPAWASIDDGKLFQYVLATHVGSGILEKRGRVFDVVDRGAGPARASSSSRGAAAATWIVRGDDDVAAPPRRGRG